jgi:hypothetical protein
LEDVDWIYLAPGGDGEHDNEPSGSIRRRS